MSSPATRSAKQAFVAYIVDLMRPFAQVVARPMFGGFGIYLDGLMFALIANERLYFKADEQSIPDFVRAGLGPFTYEFKGKPGALKYYEAPPEAYEEPQHMGTWARRGYECALRQRKPVKAKKVAPSSGALSALKGLGPQSQAMLARVGIKTEAQLRKVGAVVAYARTKAVCPQASLNLLWALEGALSGRRWQDVAETERASLLMALDDVQRHMLDDGV